MIQITFPSEGDCAWPHVRLSGSNLLKGGKGEEGGEVGEGKVGRRKGGRGTRRKGKSEGERERRSKDVPLRVCAVCSVI